MSPEEEKELGDCLTKIAEQQLAFAETLAFHQGALESMRDRLADLDARLKAQGERIAGLDSAKGAVVETTSK